MFQLLGVIRLEILKGIQAQTLANFWLAFSSGLEIVPVSRLMVEYNLLPYCIQVINKIDMENANIAYVEDQLMSHFGFSPNDIIKISAKTGRNVENLLDAILER